MVHVEGSEIYESMPKVVDNGPEYNDLRIVNLSECKMSDALPFIAALVSTSGFNHGQHLRFRAGGKDHYVTYKVSQSESDQVFVIRTVK